MKVVNNYFQLSPLKLFFRFETEKLFTQNSLTKRIYYCGLTFKIIPHTFKEPLITA